MRYGILGVVGEGTESGVPQRRGGASPSVAAAASCVRVASPRLARMLETWLSTVRSPMLRAAAISRFDRPCATNGSTSRSRRVSAGVGRPACRGGARIGVLRRGEQGEEPPVARRPGERPGAAVREAQPRPRHQVLDGARDQDLRWGGLPRHPPGEGHRDAAHPVVAHLALAGVQPGPGREAEVPGRIGDRFGAADRAGRAVEGRDDPVAGQLERAAPEVAELAGGQGPEAVLEIGPAPVAEGDRLPDRVGDLAHQDGGQDMVGRRDRPRAGDEGLDLVDEGVGVTNPREVVAARQFDQPGPGDAGGDVAALLDLVDAGVEPMQDERRHADGRQDVADVDLRVHAVEGDDGAGAGAQPQAGAEPGTECGVVCDARRYVGEPVGIPPVLVDGPRHLVEASPCAPRPGAARGSRAAAPPRRRRHRGPGRRCGQGRWRRRGRQAARSPRRRRGRPAPSRRRPSPPARRPSAPRAGRSRRRDRRGRCRACRRGSGGRRRPAAAGNARIPAPPRRTRGGRRRGARRRGRPGRRRRPGRRC